MDSWEGEEERRLGPYSVQNVGAAKAVSLAIGHNPGWVAKPTQYTRMLALILPTSEGWQAELTLPGINSTAERDLNSGPEDPRPPLSPLSQHQAYRWEGLDNKRCKYYYSYTKDEHAPDNR